jgi:integrase
MINPHKEFLSKINLDLPDSSFTKSGVSFNPQDNRWIFIDGATRIKCDFDTFPKASYPLLHGLKLALIWRFRNLAAGTAMHEFHLTLRLVKFIINNRIDSTNKNDDNQSISQITAQDILNFRAVSRSNESALGKLRKLLIEWHKTGAQGIEDNAIKVLMKLSIRNNPVGISVKTYSPKNGPFTDLEYDAIQTSILNGFREGLVSEREHLLTSLFFAVGSRPISIAALKLCDLVTPSENEEIADYIIRLPIAKQRNKLARDELMNLLLPRTIGEVLHIWVLSIHNKFSEVLSDPWQAPMFPDLNQESTTYPKGFEYHSVTQDVSREIFNLFYRLKVKSERLAGPMNITPIRFRRTYGTRLAEEGASSYEIARLMGHKDIRSCEPYIELSSKMSDNIDKALAFAMAPIAQAFSGRNIDSESVATRPNASSRIIDFRIDQSGAGLGNCGQTSYCTFSKPIGCYGCSSFEPWLDGPHEAAFDYMLQKRDELVRTTDARIAKINDRSILGCAQVILRIREMKGEGQ